MELNFQDTFNKELPADPNIDNTPRQVTEACYSFVSPKKVKRPVLIHVADEVADLIGLSQEDLESAEFIRSFSGAESIQNTHPYAMSYGGHQFGHWAGQLGDGRAINLGEVVHDDLRWALQLKGAGPTPYSRTADGFAVLRSSIREHLCSEAMHHLGVPTTRSLSLMLSGEQVLRDMMYDGNADYEKGAIVCRVSPSFIRFGNFQLLAARQDVVNLALLADYTIKYFFPEIKSSGKKRYIDFYRAVSNRTLKMVIHWQRVGFVHGVMNTDNMSILGLTIDYGPYGWLEGYDPGWTPNTTDRSHRRYRYGHQPQIALWNLLQLANALYPLVEDAEPFQDILNQYKSDFGILYFNMMRSKLGLVVSESADQNLISELETIMSETETDMTLFFRLLADVDFDAALDSVFGPWAVLKPAYYAFDEISEDVKQKWNNWFTLYKSRLNSEAVDANLRKQHMNKVNPKYVLRNYMAQLAIDAADKGNYGLISELYTLLKNPYDEQPENEKWFAKRPDWARDKVGCSMLSCSS